MHRVTRRTLLAATAGAAAAGLLPGAARAAATGWWHTPGYSVNYDGFSQNETQILASTVARVTQKRTLLAGGVAVQAPVLDDGRIYAADLTGITALSESTGERLWRFDYDVPASAPAKLVIKDEVLIALWSVPVPAPGPRRSTVMTIDAATGTPIAMADEIAPNWVDSIFVDRGMIVANLAAVGPADWHTVVLRQSDLRVAWRADWHRSPNPVIANGRLLMHSQGAGQIRDLVTGDLLWSGNGFRYNALAANTAGTKFYVAWGHSLQIVDATTGAAKWLASDLYPQSMALTPTRAYVSHQNKTVSAFDAATDRPVYWSRTFREQPLKPIVAGGVLYVAVPRDQIYALDPVTGATLRQLPYTGSTQLPVITNGRIYVAGGADITTYGL